MHDPWRDAALATPDRVAFRMLSRSGGEGVRLERCDVSWCHLDGAIEIARGTIRQTAEPTLFLVGWNDLSLLVHFVAALREGRLVGLLSPRIPDQELAQLAAESGAAIIRSGELEVALDTSQRDLASRIVLPEQSGTLIRTSGSTGAARFIRHSARQHAVSATAVKARLVLTNDDSWLWALPSFHVGGLSILWRMALSGATVVHADSGISWIEALAEGASENGITNLSLVPTQLLDTVEAGIEPPPSLRHCIVGGAALSRETLQSAVALGWPVRTTYGSTETASMVTLSRPWSGQEASSESPIHAGSALDGVSLQFKAGRLEVKAPQIGFLWPAPPEVSMQSADEWMTTSDSGELDDEGRLVIHGRTDRVIISGGENLDLSMIEARLRDVDGVQWASVIGIPDDRFGQRPVAFVRVKDTAGFDEQAIQESLESRLEKPWIPDRVLLIPTDFEGIKPDLQTQQRWAREALGPNA